MIYKKKNKERTTTPNDKKQHCSPLTQIRLWPRPFPELSAVPAIGDISFLDLFQEIGPADGEVGLGSLLLRRGRVSELDRAGQLAGDLWRDLGDTVTRRAVKFCAVLGYLYTCPK